MTLSSDSGAARVAEAGGGALLCTTDGATPKRVARAARRAASLLREWRRGRAPGRPGPPSRFARFRGVRAIERGKPQSGANSPSSPWRKSPLHSSDDASRLTALFVGYLCPICALLTPGQAGASPLSVQHGVFTTGCKRRPGGRQAAPTRRSVYCPSSVGIRTAFSTSRTSPQRSKPWRPQSRPRRTTTRSCDGTTTAYWPRLPEVE